MGWDGHWVYVNGCGEGSSRESGMEERKKVGWADGVNIREVEINEFKREFYINHPRTSHRCG